MRHEKSVDSVVFSPDGTRVVTVSEDQSARLWDGRRGTPLGEPMRHEEFGELRRVQSRWNPDRHRILGQDRRGCGTAGRARRWCADAT